MNKNDLSKFNGVILYQGPSRIDKQPIIVIATGLKGSNNRKTGKNVVQTWIIPQNINPVEAHKSGKDYTVCGNCKHRTLDSCYVNLGQAPLAVYNAWKRGIYVDISKNLQKHSSLFKDKFVRIGSYGDPTAVPPSIWTRIVLQCKNHTGYTHQWHLQKNKMYRSFCMASCDTVEEASIARQNNWNVFLVRSEGSEVPKGFFTCPASKEAGYRLTCEECKVCKGGSIKNNTGMPTIVAHGPAYKKNNYNKGIVLTIKGKNIEVNKHKYKPQKTSTISC